MTAPAAGWHDSDMQTKEEAQDAAKRLIKRLPGGEKRWKPVVTQNAGWYPSAIEKKRGRWKVHALAVGRGDSMYTAFLGEPDSPGGYWAASGSTPREAMANTWAEYRAEVEKLQAFDSEDPQEMR